MTDLTDYYENAIIEHSFNGTAMPAAPATVYIALHTGDPTESGDAAEVTAASYSREGVDTGTGFTITGNSAENANEITFPVADESWGTISHFSVWTTADGTGDPLWQSALDATKTIDANDQLRFAAGTLTAALD